MDWHIEGHEWAAEILQKHLQQNTVRHAYLFTGAPGIGRRTLALRFAQAINCSQPPTTGQPCGTCRTCTQLEKMQQADLSIVQSEEDSRSIKVEQIRELQRNLSLSPYESKYRIALLLNFQEATPSSQNALLKTLEEAPEKVILLVTADSAENLLPTITSRCEILRLRPIPVKQMTTILQNKWQLEADPARELAHLSAGRLGVANQYLQKPEQMEELHNWIEDAFDLLRSSRVTRFSYAERQSDMRRKANTRDRLRRLYTTWLTLWRDILLTVSQSRMPLTYIQFRTFTSEAARQLDFAEVQQQIQRLETAIQQLDGNLNTRLLTENILLDWPHLR